MVKPKTIYKTVYKAELFHVETMQIAYPKGEKVMHEIVVRKPTVSVFPISDRYELSLVSQYRPLLEKQTLEAVAGFIDDNEMPLQAAKRELEEETGIRATQWEMLTVIDLAASVFRAKNYLFLAKGLETGKPHPDAHEDIAVVKISIEDAVRKVMTSEITLSSTIIGILLLDTLRKEKKL